MESIVFFGKGGIGKSTIASNITSILSAKGRKVLHIGCDPKGDSTLTLTGRRIKHFSDAGVFTGESALRASIHPSRLKNVSCIEAGGPQPGVGCAGAGIGAMLDLMNEYAVLRKDGYDAAVFDVLGDVVCGGFAAPLRRGLAGKAVIVVSEEILSLYAANKLIAMVNNYARNGVWLAGLAVNAKDQAGVRLAEAFASAARTRVLAVIPRDPAVSRAEKQHKPVVLSEPRSPASSALIRLAGAIEAASRPAVQPRFLGDTEFQELVSGGAAAAAPAAASAGAKLPPAERIRRAGFRITGFAGGQVVCSWTGSAGPFTVFISPLDEAREGMARAGDWAFCFAPDRKKVSSGYRPELEAAAAGLAGVRFDDFIASFSGGVDFYGNVSAFDEFSSHSLSGEDGSPKEPHMGFGQWHRFVFPEAGSVSVPPGAVMLEHGDCECRFSSASATPLSTFQKSSGGLAGRSVLSLEPMLPKEDPVAVNTGLAYADVVRGDEAKVGEALEAAAAMTGPGGLVEFYSTCSPMLMGTDVDGLIEKAASRGGVKILRDRFNSFYTGNPVKIKARAEYAAARIKALGKAKPRYDVNFCGFGSALGPLQDLLEAAGISCAPPDGEYYGNIAASRLQLLAEPDPVLAGALEATGRKWICPAAPYGVAATRTWLARVAKAVGRRAGSLPALSRAASAQWRALSRSAGGFSVLFVCEASELTGLDGSPMVHGVPLLSFLAEAGFGLKFLVRSRDASSRAAASAALKKLPAAVRRRCSLDFFDSPAALSKKLAADRGARLLYSDIPMDPRAARAGKAPFSGALFEPGFEGAVETLRRLTALCAWDLNGKKFAA